MRHASPDDCIVITTTEQAEAMHRHLEGCRASAAADDYATERVKPIKWMTCACCGSSYQGRQWWNQDTGYGLGDCCVQYCHANPTPGVETGSYGVAGIHFLLTQAEKDNPPLIENRGVPLYGLDDRLRIEYDGCVFWKGREIEHYSGSRLYDSEDNKDQARELIRRCEILEARSEEISSASVLRRWTD